MPARTRTPAPRRHPTYRRFRRPNAPDLACVDLPALQPGGKPRCYYLGGYGTPESRERYNWLLGTWIAGGCKAHPEPTWGRVTKAPAPGPQPRLFVSAGLVAAGLVRHLRDTARRPDGSIRDGYNLAAAMRLFRDTLRHRNLLDLTSHELDQVQAAMVRKGWALATIRDRMRYVRLAVRRAAKAGVLPVLTLQHLELLDSIGPNTPGVKPRRKVRPVSDELVDATLPHLNRHVGAFVRLMRLTGARPSELAALRPLDLDVSGPVWLYRPGRHKTSHKGRSRVVALGPAAQEVLRPFLADCRLDAPVFDPRKAEAERRAEQHARRKTPLGYGNSPGTNVKENPQCSVGDRYTATTLRRSIHRVCERHGIEPWNVYQLRHTAATRLRREGGLEAAALALGHSDATLTAAVYAEADEAKLVEIMGRVG